MGPDNIPGVRNHARTISIVEARSQARSLRCMLKIRPLGRPRGQFVLRTRGGAVGVGLARAGGGGRGGMGLSATVLLLIAKL
jgi:hypothetical protein